MTNLKLCIADHELLTLNEFSRISWLHMVRGILFENLIVKYSVMYFYLNFRSMESKFDERNVEKLNFFRSLQDTNKEITSVWQISMKLLDPHWRQQYTICILCFIQQDVNSNGIFFVATMPFLILSAQTPSVAKIFSFLFIPLMQKLASGLLWWLICFLGDPSPFTLPSPVKHDVHIF